MKLLGSSIYVREHPYEENRCHQLQSPVHPEHRNVGKTVEELKVNVSADTEIVEGKLLNGRQSIASVKAWTDTLDSV